MCVWIRNDHDITYDLGSEMSMDSLYFSADTIACVYCWWHNMCKRPVWMATDSYKLNLNELGIKSVELMNFLQFFRNNKKKLFRLPNKHFDHSFSTFIVLSSLFLLLSFLSSSHNFFFISISSLLLGLSSCVSYLFRFHFYDVSNAYDQRVNRVDKNSI